MFKEIIIVGAGGHGKVIADIIEKSGDKVIGFLDDNTDRTEIMGYPVLGKTQDCEKYADKEFFIAIGNNVMRKNIVNKYADIKYYTAIHPMAIIAREVQIGEGTCVMAGAIINSSTAIGSHCIVNSGSVVEHDNRIGDFVHLSPGAILCGTVFVGECTHIGAGAVIKNNITIAPNSVIGAGAAVVSNINYEGVYVGVPAKEIGK